MANHSVIRRLSALCSNSTSQDVILDSYPYLSMIAWNNIVARDPDHAPTRIELLLMRSSREYYLNSQAPAAAGLCVSLPNSIIAPGDYRICARFVGATAGDTLEVCACGEELG